MVDSQQYARAVLSKQLRDISMQNDSGVSVGLVNESDLFLWNVMIEGPIDSLYEGGFFKA